MPTDLIKDAKESFSPATVAASYLKALLDYCHSEHGLDHSELLSQIGLASNDFSDPHQRISAHYYNRLIEFAAKETGDSAFGWHFGSQVGAAAFNLLGYLTMSAETLGDAAQSLQSFEQLVSNIGHTVIERADHSGFAKWQANNSCRQFSYHIVEAVFAGWISFGRTIVGWPVPIKKIHLQHSKPQGRNEHQSTLIDCAIIYDQPVNAIEFDQKWLSLPLAQAQQAVYKTLLMEAEKIIQQIQSAPTYFTAQIKQLITQNLYQGTLSIDTIAQQLNVSRRTLQRHLNQENIQYRELVEQSKQAMAKKLLQENQLPLTTVAGILGFSEQSSFNRAFKRWTGLSPKSYLKAQT